MSIGIVENVTGSFAFAKDRLVGKWLDWLILIILFIIPIIGWALLFGFLARVYRGGEPKLGDWIKMLIDGILMWIVFIVYMIIPAIVFVILGGAAVLTSFASVDGMMNPTGALGAALGLGVGVILSVIIAIIFGFLATMGMVRFAKEEKFGAAFQVGELFKIIGKIGWLHYILSWIVLAVIFAIIYFIVGLITGLVAPLGMIILWIIGPVLVIWQGKFYAHLYESA
ncbi:DUF4013 domain-containing protein [Methanorbis furvi]|uniref:DUF4013 domain-containing protein n=1 Tax=Methanorbis furvi TaxID=3028299 RepID=A0AAE4MCW6_9EURY|nr:hypothetical protein [Methanocorpusculaceae archaeon Ag1]